MDPRRPAVLERTRPTATLVQGRTDPTPKRPGQKKVPLIQSNFQLSLSPPYISLSIIYLFPCLSCVTNYSWFGTKSTRKKPIYNSTTNNLSVNLQFKHTINIVLLNNGETERRSSKKQGTSFQQQVKISVCFYQSINLHRL